MAYCWWSAPYGGGNLGRIKIDLSSLEFNGKSYEILSKVLAIQECNGFYEMRMTEGILEFTGHEYLDLSKSGEVIGCIASEKFNPETGYQFKHKIMTTVITSKAKFPIETGTADCTNFQDDIYDQTGLGPSAVRHMIESLNYAYETKLNSFMKNTKSNAWTVR